MKTKSERSKRRKPSFSSFPLLIYIQNLHIYLLVLPLYISPCRPLFRLRCLLYSHYRIKRTSGYRHLFQCSLSLPLCQFDLCESHHKAVSLTSSSYTYLPIISFFSSLPFYYYHFLLCSSGVIETALLCIECDIQNFDGRVCGCEYKQMWLLADCVPHNIFIYFWWRRTKALAYEVKMNGKRIF